MCLRVRIFPLSLSVSFLCQCVVTFQNFIKIEEKREEEEEKKTNKIYFTAVLLISCEMRHFLVNRILGENTIALSAKTTWMHFSTWTSRAQQRRKSSFRYNNNKLQSKITVRNVAHRLFAIALQTNTENRWLYFLDYLFFTCNVWVNYYQPKMIW